ncbi:VOC family protein [Marinicella gelatinilytica]|uniref:VOC family protein n=1 Tax=Marinicella gelatinilytica TaxID=2996017 RepID=UPI002260C2C2|nr:VOC family protein [Marinicella gelatinilytica]MCX7545610.1 VOC family protein [Marinicella gelatinilytica]
MNLNQVTIPVSDLKKAIHFYQQLGFILIVDSSQYARFECPEGHATFSLSLETAPFHNGAVIYFEHEKLDQWVAELKKKGIVFDQEPTDQTYLWREAVTLDPSGNKVKLYWAGDNRRFPPWRVKKEDKKSG